MDRFRAIDGKNNPPDDSVSLLEVNVNSSKLVSNVRSFIDNWDTFDLVERELRVDWRQR